MTRLLAILSIFALGVMAASAQQLKREQWGAVPVDVSHTGNNWLIKGQKNSVTLNQSDLTLSIQAGPTTWTMKPSAVGDIVVKTRGEVKSLRLADARNITVTPYDAAFKTGIKITLSGWKENQSPLDLQLFFTICLQGKDEELVFDIAASEHETVVRQLDWPGALDAREVDYTLLSNGRGTLLPRDWPKEYYPIRSITPEGRIAATDHSLLQSHVIESWSMSWWGFQKGKSGMMVIVETPDDASYQFSHPAGGPTVIGPHWRAQLGRFGYVRTVRLCFIANGNYVDMAKRYRRYVKESGLFVSLKEK